jgi:AraC-like DNA-binding protein
LSDPLAEVVALLQPGASRSKLATGAGRWRVNRSDNGQPFYSVILEGCCRLAAEGHEPIILRAGDFVLIPSATNFSMSSATLALQERGDTRHTVLPNGEVRNGDPDGVPDVRSLVGHCTFRSPDAALLASLLPRLIHVRGETRFTTLVQLVREETRAQRPARDVILERLLEVLLIEALRSIAEMGTPRGLVRGLADERLGIVLRQMHENPSRQWTVTELAKSAGLSRSAFFERFSRAVGVSPMEYLISWRMALAKNMLLNNEGGMKEIAERIGYGSASAFSIAFTRSVGLPPTRYARSQQLSGIQ